MRKYGLIGYPLGHSFSQSFFSAKFEKENIEGCSYSNFPIASIGMLPGLIESEPELQGLNVTIPYKSEVLRFLDKIDPEAEEIGAVNVLKIHRGNGKIRLTGFNSDVTGIRDSLKPLISKSSKEAVVLGTGGSSKAVCHVLRHFGLRITQVSRISKPGVISYDDLDAQTLHNATVIVNTTPLGMFPDINARPDIDYAQLHEDQVLFDLVYNPEYTLFLKSGLERGCKVVTGLKMLHSQALRAWDIWNDENL
jgi:shikimate dehydrogenase